MQAKRILFPIFFLSFLSLAAAATANAQALGVTLPTTPGTPTATLLPPSQATISWAASTESSGTIEDYNVYRNGTQLTTTAGTSIVDSELTPGTYIYTVTAVDANGNVSMLSSPASLTFVVDNTPPSTPTGLTFSGATTTNSAYTPTTITVSWSASTDNVGVVGYNVYRDGTQISTTTSAFTATSISDSILPGLHTYTVDAYDAAQNISSRSAPLSVFVSANNTPPSTPANISAQQVSASGVTISWSLSTGPVGVAGYQVFRNGIQIASVAGSPYADSGLSPGVTYAYALAAYDIAGNVSAKSTPVFAMVQQALGPGVPYILSSGLVGTSSVRISWTPSGDALPITDYNIFRNGGQVASVTSTSYLDQGLATGTYSYFISATDIAGAVSATSSAVSVAVPVISILPLPVAISLTPTTGPTTISTSTPSVSFTQFLYFGLRGAQVQAMQSLFGRIGYLPPVDATGYFGNLTLAAVKKFQCDKNVVCTGGAGWGTVGPRTRAALNAAQ